MADGYWPRRTSVRGVGGLNHRDTEALRESWQAGKAETRAEAIERSDDLILPQTA